MFGVSQLATCAVLAAFMGGLAAGSLAGARWAGRVARPLLAYALMTAGEVLISVTSLEFFYTQAPLAMKSAIMAIKMFAVSLGNLVTAGVNFAIMNEDGTRALEGEAYFLFFAGMLVVNGLIFIPIARAYQVKNYMQGDEA